MHKERDLAYANLTYCQGYTEQEILESEANLKLAEANLSQAEKTYQDLLAHAGIDPDEVSIAEAEVKNAEAQLKKAQAELEGASLVAPMDGTVIAINADEGEAVTGRNADESEGEVVFLTLADLEHPLVRVYIDETDLQSFAVGCSAEVTFDAIPGRVFEGVVTQVSPVLVAMGNVNVLEGLVKLENAVLTPQKTLVLGLSGTVDISCKKASNVLLVPVAAVHEDDSSVYVYVLNQSGEKEKREIEVGARSSTFVEVRSGLQEGERVIIQ
jgi:HlyD family secretion protein